MRHLLAIAELGLGCFFFSFGIEAMAQRQMGRRSPFRLREFHHGYAGGMLVVLGWYLNNPIGLVLQLVGLVLTIDDLYQHVRQTVSGDINVMSPLHRLFAATLWQFSAVRAVTRFLDEWWLTGVVGLLLVLWLFP